MTLRSNAFYCKDARSSEEISNLAQHCHRWPLADKRVVTRKKFLRSKGFLACKDARGSLLSYGKDYFFFKSLPKSPPSTLPVLEPELEAPPSMSPARLRYCQRLCCCPKSIANMVQ
ncbi:MAG: hypothetical protein IJP72_07275 [Bacteroidales bacterium]|nr:hypothetical protein [Bacteroidales bacterium]